MSHRLARCPQRGTDERDKGSERLFLQSMRAQGSVISMIGDARGYRRRVTAPDAAVSLFEVPMISPEKHLNG